MSTITPLQPLDFPLTARGQFVYRRTSAAAILGPVPVELAKDIAFRLNRDEAARDPGGMFAADHQLFANPSAAR